MFFQKYRLQNVVVTLNYVWCIEYSGQPHLAINDSLLMQAINVCVLNTPFILTIVCFVSQESNHITIPDKKMITKNMLFWWQLVHSRSSPVKPLDRNTEIACEEKGLKCQILEDIIISDLQNFTWILQWLSLCVYNRLTY